MIPSSLGGLGIETPIILMSAHATVDTALEAIAEGAFLDLQAPVVRVTGYDTIMPYYRNEQYYLPQVEDIVKAVEQVIAL